MRGRGPCGQRACGSSLGVMTVWLTRRRPSGPHVRGGLSPAPANPDSTAGACRTREPAGQEPPVEAFEVWCDRQCVAGALQGPAAPDAGEVGVRRAADAVTPRRAFPWSCRSRQTRKRPPSTTRRRGRCCADGDRGRRTHRPFGPSQAAGPSYSQGVRRPGAFVSGTASRGTGRMATCGGGCPAPEPSGIRGSDSCAGTSPGSPLPSRPSPWRSWPRRPLWPRPRPPRS